MLGRYSFGTLVEAQAIARQQVEGTVMPPPADKQPSTPPPVGAVAAQYHVLEQIGVGGHAAVYRGTSRTDLSMRVAIKVLHNPIADEARERRFERECAVLRRLANERNVVTLLDAGVDAGRAYIVTPLYDGSYASRLESLGRLQPDEVISVGESLANALAAAHRAGIVHRDLKPSNVFVNDDGTAVLGDFGTAGLVDSETITGSLALSIAYAAPEVLEVGVASPSSDLYSLGVTMYQLLSGVLPFGGSAASDGDAAGIAALLRRVATQEPPPLVVDDAPPALIALIMALLEKDPRRRPADAAAVAVALRAITPAAPAVHIGRRRAHRVAVVAATVAGATLLGLGAEALRSGSTETARPEADDGIENGRLSVNNLERALVASVPASAAQPSRPRQVPAAATIPESTPSSEAVPSTAPTTMPATVPTTMPTTMSATKPPTTVARNATPSTTVARTTVAPTTVTPTVAPTTVAPTTEQSGATACETEATPICSSFDDGMGLWSDASAGGVAQIVVAAGPEGSASPVLAMIPADTPDTGASWIERSFALPPGTASMHIRTSLYVEPWGPDGFWTNLLTLSDEQGRQWRLNLIAADEVDVRVDMWTEDANGRGVGGSPTATFATGRWMCVEFDVEPGSDVPASLRIDGRPVALIAPFDVEPLGSQFEVQLGSILINPPNATPTVYFDSLTIQADTPPGC